MSRAELRKPKQSELASKRTFGSKANISYLTGKPCLAGGGGPIRLTCFGKEKLACARGDPTRNLNVLGRKARSAAPASLGRN